MIGFTTQKLKEEWLKAPVALRLIAEALDELHGGGTIVFRVNAPTRFEQGVHSTGLAMDINLIDRSMEELQRIASKINERFRVPGVARQVCTVMADPVNLPSGKRLDTPHIHLQIPFDWKHEPRAFLRAYGYIQSENTST